MPDHPKVATCLWFNGNAEEAVNFYVTLLPDSRVTHVLRMAPDGPAVMVEFTLGGTPYLALNGGPAFTLTEAVSISVLTKDQAETDRLWSILTSNGGRESQCCWLKDRYGLSWQIVPEALIRCLRAPDRAAAGRAMQAMMGMQKIDIAALEAAFRGT